MTNTTTHGILATMVLRKIAAAERAAEATTRTYGPPPLLTSREPAGAAAVPAPVADHFFARRPLATPRIS